MNTKLSAQKLDVWRLFITAQAKLIKQIDSDMRHADAMPLHWYDVLIELYEAPDHKLPMNELADKVVLTRSGLTRLVDRLEKEGYIGRELNPNDRRSFYAVLTEDGVRTMKSAWTVYEQSILDHFAKHLDEAETDALLQSFRRILQHLDA